MKKLLLALVVAGITSSLYLQAQPASNLMNLSRPPVFGASPFQDSLWAFDTITYQRVYGVAPSCPGFTITGITGLTQHPCTGEIYVIMKLSAVSGRVLGKFDIITGVCTQVGNLGDNFSTISFREDGQLFGVTGDGATVPETMYLIDHTNGTKTLAAALGAGADGEIIAYNKDDNFFYHWSGNGTVVMEKVMSVAPYTATNIPISGTAGGETFGSVYLGGGVFLNSNISSRFVKVTSAGVYGSQLSSLPDDIRGLAIPMRWVHRPGNAVICADDSSLFTAMGGQKYQWVRNGVIIPGATSSNYYANQTGWYNCIIQTDTINCSAGDTALFGRGLTVNPLPVVNILPSPSEYICASGDSLLLTTTTSGVTFQWYSNGTMMSGATNDTVYVQTSALYNLEVTDGNGCNDTSSVPTFVGLAPASIDLSPSGTAGACFGDSLLLTANTGAGQYNWMLNGSVIATTTSEQLYVNAAGNYTVETTYGSSCVDTSSVTAVSFAPQYDVTPGGSGTQCIGSSITLSATAGGSSYAWLLNGAPIAGATNASHNANQTGTYACIITFPGCTDTTITTFSLTMVDCSGVDEQTEQTRITVFPNPASHHLSVTVEGAELQRVEVVDLTGRKVMSQTGVNGTVTVNVEALKDGVYLVNITTDKGRQTRRFVKN